VQDVKGNGELLSGEACDVHVTFAGIAHPGAGLERERKLAFSHAAPIGKAAFVRQAKARCEEVGPGIALEVGVEPDRRHLLVERKLVL
jgi:hypothetical protein